jgi:hypothetical protein
MKVEDKIKKIWSKRKRKKQSRSRMNTRRSHYVTDVPNERTSYSSLSQEGRNTMALDMLQDAWNLC